MNPAAITPDAHGDRYATVHVEELDEWAWLLSRIEDWLLHAHDETIADWAQFAGPCGEALLRRMRLPHIRRTAPEVLATARAQRWDGHPAHEGAVDGRRPCAVGTTCLLHRPRRALAAYMPQVHSLGVSMVAAGPSATLRERRIAGGGSCRAAWSGVGQANPKPLGKLICIAGLLGWVRAIARVELDAAPPPPNPHTHLRDLLIELGAYAAGRGAVVLVHLDEVQNVTDADDLSQLLVALGDAIRHTFDATDAAGTIHRRVLPIVVYLTGLSEFTELATSLAGATFARRFKPVRLRHLDDDDLREALAVFTGPGGWPVAGAERGVAMTDGAVAAMLACVLGDPFLFQLVGKAAWDAEPNDQVITDEHVRAGWQDVKAEARSHVERLVERLPDRERDFLEVMVRLAPSTRTLTAIAGKLDKTAAQLGSASQRLEDRGIIERGRPYRFTARTIEGLLSRTWP